MNVDMNVERERESPPVPRVIDLPPNKNMEVKKQSIYFIKESGLSMAMGGWREYEK